MHGADGARRKLQHYASRTNKGCKAQMMSAGRLVPLALTAGRQRTCVNEIFSGCMLDCLTSAQAGLRCYVMLAVTQRICHAFSMGAKQNEP
jgi:hypothetical protein